MPGELPLQTRCPTKTSVVIPLPEDTILLFRPITVPPVYLVDDDAIVRQSTAFLLDTIGIACRAFDDGAAFLAEIDALPDGCLLIDRVMPHVGGLEVIHRLNALDRKMPIILMTAATSPSRLRLAENIGPHALLEKPFDETALVAALENGFEVLAGSDTDATGACAAVALLTPDQTLILRGLIAGMDTAALALRLSVPETMIRRNRVALKQRIAAGDVHQAIAIGERAGLAPLQPYDDRNLD